MASQKSRGVGFTPPVGYARQKHVGPFANKAREPSVRKPVEDKGEANPGPNLARRGHGPPGWNDRRASCQPLPPPDRVRPMVSPILLLDRPKTVKPTPRPARHDPEPTLGSCRRLGQSLPIRQIATPPNHDCVTMPAHPKSRPEARPCSLGIPRDGQSQHLVGAIGRPLAAA